jgi:F-type H+-transporting ATPase subunit b
MTELFIKKVNALGQEEQEKIKSKLKDSAEGITVATSFEIPERKMQAVQESVRNITGTDARPEFVLSKDILCGIELRVKGYALGWNVDAYLKYLEEEFGKVLES